MIYLEQTKSVGGRYVIDWADGRMIYGGRI